MIKVCGLRRKEDIGYANILKPAYVGFIFAESKRQVTKEQAKDLKEMLDSNIKTVGIFVNEDIKKVIQIACMVDLDVIQLHGDEDENYIKRLKDKLKLKNACKEIWKDIRVKDKERLNDIDTLDVDGLLLDTYSKEAYGGLGETFNWDLVKNLNLNKKLILAGGIDEENVEVAKSTVKPDIIDVSSGIETKGFKDFEKMKLLIERGR